MNEDRYRDIQLDKYLAGTEWKTLKDYRFLDDLIDKVKREIDEIMMAECILNGVDLDDGEEPEGIREELIEYFLDGIR